MYNDLHIRESRFKTLALSRLTDAYFVIRVLKKKGLIYHRLSCEFLKKCIHSIFKVRRRTCRWNERKIFLISQLHTIKFLFEITKIFAQSVRVNFLVCFSKSFKENRILNRTRKKKYVVLFKFTTKQYTSARIYKNHLHAGLLSFASQSRRRTNGINLGGCGGFE